MPRQTLHKSPHPQTEAWPPERPGMGLLSDESSKHVYRQSCAQIAAAIESSGFKYAKSKQRCRRTIGAFENDITFQSSHYNVSGRHVQLWMHANVSSIQLQKWRAQYVPPDSASTHVAGGMVHLLGTRFALVQWELADPNDRAATILDAVEFIRKEVLPFFSRFEDTPALVSELATHAVPAFDLVPAVEFCLCFGGKAEGQAALNRFVRERPDLQSAIAAEQVTPSANTLNRPGNYVEQVVCLRLRYDLR